MRANEAATNVSTESLRKESLPSSSEEGTHGAGKQTMFLRLLSAGREHGASWAGSLGMG